jgi:hypothetical protein
MLETAAVLVEKDRNPIAGGFFYWVADADPTGSRFFYWTLKLFCWVGGFFYELGAPIQLSADFSNRSRTFFARFEGRT